MKYPGWLITGLAALMLSGCSMVPKPLQVADEGRLVAFTQVQESVDAFVGEPVRWGGVIVSVTNKESGSELEVLQHRLNSYGRPVVDDQSAGRFKVVTDDFVDPDIYTKGRSVTIVGQIKGVQEGKIGDFPYRYPVVEAAHIYLWKKMRVVDIPLYDPWFELYYGHYYPSFYHPLSRRVIIRDRNKGAGH